MKVKVGQKVYVPAYTAQQITRLNRERTYYLGVVELIRGDRVQTRRWDGFLVEHWVHELKDPGDHGHRIWYNRP